MNGKERPFLVDIQAQDPENMPVENLLSEREQYDIMWNEDRIKQRAWNEANFTGWNGKRFLTEGQSTVKK